jgi:hypothetical protein
MHDLIKIKSLLTCGIMSQITNKNETQQDN